MENLDETSKFEHIDYISETVRAACTDILYFLVCISECVISRVFDCCRPSCRVC